MLVVALRETLHGTKVAGPEREGHGGGAARHGGNLEHARLAQRERNHQAVRHAPLEERLVVGVPADRLRPVAVQVEVATVGPPGAREAAEWHARLEEPVDPRCKRDGGDPDAPISVVA